MLFYLLLATDASTDSEQHYLVQFHADDKQKLQEHKLPIMHGLPWHFTASAVTIYRGHLLLIHHKRIGAWLPPGGHLDGDELPHQAAIRETLEETGLPIRILSEPMPASDKPDAFFLPQPLCIQGVRATEKGSDIYHIDIAFLAEPINEAPDDILPVLSQTDDAVYGARWVALSALGALLLAKNVREIVDLAISKTAS